jgi:hypothetical protein
MGLRNFISAPRNVAGLPKKSTLSITSQSSQRRYISERPDGRGKIYEFEDVRPRQPPTPLRSTPDASQAPDSPLASLSLTLSRSSPSSKTPPTHAS